LLRHVTIIHPNMHRTIGGSERLMADLAIGLSKRNVETHFVTGICHTIWLRELSDANVTVRQLGSKALGSYRFWVFMKDFARKLSLRVDPNTQVVLASGFPSPLAAQIFRKRHRGTIACHLHDAPAVLHDRNGIRVLPLHERIFYDAFSRLHRNSDVEAVRSCDLVIANSKLTRRINSQVYGLEEDEIEVVYPGVLPNRLRHSTGGAHRVRDHIKEKSTVLFFPNGVQRWRSPNVALRALREIADDCWLAIFTGGSSSEITRFDRQMEKLNLHRIVWRIDDLSPSEVVAAYHSSTVVISTPMRDPFGLIPAEALGCGCPAIASRTSGISEILRAGEEIVCVQPGSLEQLLSAITKLIHDDRTRRRIAENGQRKVLNYLTINRFVDEIYAKLQNLA